MNNTGRTIAKNATVLMVSQLISWALSLVLTIYLPRYLGAEGIGKYQLAASIWAVASIGITFGMETFLIKEVARDPERCNEFLTSTILLRLMLYTLGFIIVNIYVRSVGYPALTVQVINIMGWGTLLGLFSGVFVSIFQAFERMEYYSVTDIISKFVGTVITIAALFSGFKLVQIAWVSVFTSFLSILIQVYGLSRLQKYRFVFRPDQFGWILKSSASYLLVSGFLVAYNQIDVIIISILINETQIGWYSAARRLYGTFLFIPSILVTAVFPAFSRLFKNDPNELHRLLARSLKILLLVGVPIGLGISAIADPLIVLLFGRDFANGGPVLAMMGVSLIATHLNGILGKYFIATDRQAVWTWAMGLAAVLTIPLDLILIPWCQKQFGVGAIGGGLSFIVTEGFQAVFGLIMLPKGFLGWKSIWFGGKVFISGMAMVCAAWLLRGYFIAIPILAGAITYLGLIVLFKVISQEEWIFIKDLGTRIFLRFRRFFPHPTPAKVQ